PIRGASTGRRREERLDEAPNDCFSALEGFVGVNLAHALRLSGGDGAIAFGDALEKAAIGLFNAIAHEGEGGLAGEQALRTDFVREEHQQGQVWARVAD